MEAKYLGATVALSAELVQLFAEGVMSADADARLLWLQAYNRLLYSSAKQVVCVPAPSHAQSAARFQPGSLPVFATSVLRSLFVVSNTPAHFDAVVALLTSFLHGSPQDALLVLVPLVFCAQQLAIQKSDERDHAALIAALDSELAFTPAKGEAPAQSRQGNSLFMVLTPLDTVEEGEEEEPEAAREEAREPKEEAGDDPMPEIVLLPNEVEKAASEEEDTQEAAALSAAQPEGDFVRCPQGVLFYVLEALVRVMREVAAVISSEDLAAYCDRVQQARDRAAWSAEGGDATSDGKAVFLFKEVVVQCVIRSPLLLSSSGGRRRTD